MLLLQESRGKVIESLLDLLYNKDKTCIFKGVEFTYLKSSGKGTDIYGICSVNGEPIIEGDMIDPNKYHFNIYHIPNYRGLDYVQGPVIQFSWNPYTEDQSNIKNSAYNKVPLSELLSMEEYKENQVRIDSEVIQQVKSNITKTNFTQPIPDSSEPTS